MKKFIIILLSNLIGFHLALSYETTVGGYLIEDITLNVPDVFNDINEALSWLDTKSISKDATATILVSNGSYTYDDTIVIDHPNANRIHITGESSSSVTLSFAVDTDGITCNDGNALGLINGLTIEGSVSQGIPVGILSTRGSSIYIGSDVIIREFGKGISADSNSTIFCEGVTVNDCTKVGFQSAGSSNIYASYSTSDNNRYGYSCAIGSSMAISGSQILNNEKGVMALESSTVRCESCTISNNTVGIQCQENSFVRDTSATYSGNTTDQVTLTGGMIE